MSDANSTGHSTEGAGFIKTPAQLIVVVVLAFVVPIAVIFTIIHFVVGGDKSRAAPAMSDRAVAERIKPVGSVPDIEKGSSPLVPAPAVVVIADATDAGKAPAANGKSVYDSSCMACHASGVAGAPKLGDKTAWAPRVSLGLEALHTNSLKGKNAMPPKGGNLSLSDADVKAAVEYMVSQAK